MSGTDPEGQQPPLDRTQAYVPEGAGEAPPPASNLPKIPGITLHFELARGGMGIVYSGRQDFLDRRVAVKLLAVELGGEKFAQRFRREAKILAGIKHPNIVACHSAGTTDDGQSYLVMEFVDGPNLKTWVGEHGPLSCSAALRMTRAVAQALSHAFLLDVIHRDVKPENILLETVTSTALDLAFPFTPKLVDLGLARMTHETAGFGLTSPGSVMGTPSTMSPEQFDEPDAVDFRTDIYGLGCAFYEMLTGQPAFRGRKLTDIVTKKREPAGPNPCAENPQLPDAVGELVSCMLSANRDARPGSYKELDERLTALLATMPAEKRGVSPSVTKVRASTPPGGTRNLTDATMPGPRPDAPKPPPTVTPSKAPPPPPPNPTLRASGPPPTALPAKTGPGLLRTAEFDFLAKGGGPAAPATPAFRDGSEEAQPATAAKTSVLETDTRSKQTGVLVGLGVLALGVAVTAFFALRGGNTGGNGGSGPDPTGTNHPPEKVTFTSPDTGKFDRVDLGKKLVLVATAKDPDQDALTYTWSAPDEVGVRPDNVQGNKVTLTFEDGLPGVVFPIKVSVNDGKATTTGTHEVTIGDCKATNPLLGFDAGGSNWNWVIDKIDGLWTPVTDTGAASGKARVDQTRTLKTVLGRETYWEWSGFLESEPYKDINAYAETEVRLEIGDRGWSILLMRTGEEGRHWSVELLDATLANGQWQRKPLEPKQRIEWDEPKEMQDEPFGWFSLQRRETKLVLQIGQAVKLLSTSEIQVPSDKKHLIEGTLGGFAGEPALTLSVKNGTGRFRLRVR